MAGPFRDLQLVVGRPHRRRPAAKLGIQLLDHLHRHAGPFRDLAEVDRAVDRDPFGAGDVRRHDVQSVLSRIPGDHDRRQDQRHVVARFARQVPARRRQLPEVVASGALHRALHAAGAAVVGRQRQVPVAEHLVERGQVFRGGARGLFRIGALVDVPVVLQTVLERRCRCMNCQMPLALALDTALGLNALSISGT